MQFSRLLSTRLTSKISGLANPSASKIAQAKINLNLETKLLTSSLRCTSSGSLHEDGFIASFDKTHPLDQTAARERSGNVFHNDRLEWGVRRHYRGRVKAAIFDWGGTVVDCGVLAPALAYIELFKEEGVEITEEEARMHMGLHRKVLIAKILEHEAVRRRWKKAKGGKGPTEDDIERMYQKFTPVVMENISKYTNVIDGVSDIVSRLRGSEFGLKIGTTTGYPPEVLKILEKASSSQGFIPDASVSFSEVPQVKPSPFMVWLCATRMAVFPSDAIVKVDDTINGIHEGLTAGVWTVGVAKTSSYVGLTEHQLAEVSHDDLDHRLDYAYETLRDAGSHYVIDTIKELPLVINDINRRLANGERP